jgi:hypothetical protein
MDFKVASDARPQFNLLLFATIVSVLLWFTPFAHYVVYPLQLFATFIHEGSHALTAVITGSSVQSLTVSPDASGAVWSAANGWLAQLLISSAGYVGTTAFGVLLLFWIRAAYSARLALHFSAGFVGFMTLVFGLVFPIWNVFSINVSFGSVAFTVLSGALLAVGLFAVAKFASLKWANFALSFLAVQCLLNAFFSLRDLFYISTVTGGQTDAANMANATGIPAAFWVLMWIGISVAITTLALRMFAARKYKTGSDSLYE